MNRLLTCLFGLLALATQAQNTTQSTNALDAYWNITLTDDQKLQTVLVKSQTAIPDPTSSVNTISLQQNGDGNHAMLQTPSGSMNRLELTQLNNGNNTDAYLTGANNSVVLNQTGGSNTINFSLNGTNNRFLISQDGNDTVNMLGLQKDNTRLELVQKSGANSFTLDNSSLFTDPLSTGIPNLRIEQSGGASITVHQGKVIGN